MSENVLVGIFVVAVSAMVIFVTEWLLSESDEEYEDYLRNKRGWYK